MPLRPKTFAVLAHLVENAGRVVTRAELVASVWGNARGAETAPKYCIRELREALGDRVEAPTYIESVGRIGYRFIAPVVETPPLPAAGAFGDGRPSALLVGRDSELQELEHALGAALRGERQLVFVSGDAGIGKTSTVEAFLARAGAGICIGRGNCIPQFGAAEAYLPVLQALGRLANGPEPAALAELLARLAPSWLAQMPALLEAVREDLRGHAQGATQHRMLREIGDAIEVLAREVPVVLLLEDLHWGDYSSLDFIAAVAHDPRPARLLLVVTHRSELADDHALGGVVRELVGRGKARSLALAGISEAAVIEYLDRRFEGHDLPASLAPLLFRLTGGTPFFLRNLLDDLVAQHMIEEVEGAWRLQVSAETVARRVPRDSRLLIEQQIAALPRERRALLEAAALVGLDFCAESIASALDLGVDESEEALEDLARRGVFIVGDSEGVWPDGTRSPRYRFRHALLRQLWAERLPPSRRRRLHLRIGERLERAHVGDPQIVAAELALHFEQGGDLGRAARYHLAAAHNAIRRSAHREAVDQLNAGLRLLAELPEDTERDYLELDLRMGLGSALTATKGYTAVEVEETYRRSLALSDRLRDPWHIVQALLGLWPFYLVRGDLNVARPLAERCAREVGRAPDLAVAVHNIVGATALWRGELSASRKHLELSAATSQDLGQPGLHATSVLYDATNPAVANLSHLGWVLWALGDPKAAQERNREAVALARRLSHPYSLSYALSFGATLCCYRRDPQGALEQTEEAMRLADEGGFPFWQAMAATLRGWAVVVSSRNRDGLTQMRAGLAALDALGVNAGRAGLLALLAEACHICDETEEGRRAVDAAQAIAGEAGEDFHAAEVYRWRGVLALVGDANSAESERHYRRAIAVARAQRARSWELRASTSLARLWHSRGRTDGARQLLERACRWFGDDLDTPDLRDARALAAELRRRRGAPPGAQRAVRFVRSR